MSRINSLLQLLKKPSQREISELLLWSEENALIIEPLDGLNFDIEKLSMLDKFLENKRVVYLGEEDHWIHEKTDYRLIMLRYLISRGWRYIGEEIGWSDGIRIDKYIENGEESYLEKIATYGYRGALRIDREDMPKGILKSSNDNYPLSEFKSEQLCLTRVLREINLKYEKNSDRIHFFGFDVDAVAGGGYEDIEILLSPFKHELAAMRILEMLKRIHGETIEDEISRLKMILAAIKELECNLKRFLEEKQYDMLYQYVLTLHDSFEFNCIANSAVNYKELNVAMAVREKAMFHHVKFILSKMEPDDKLVLMGHNRHLSKEISAISNVGAAPPGGGHVPSIGTYINQLLPGQVFSIWQLYNHGSSSQPFINLSSEYVSGPNTLNAVLAKIGSNFFIPTAGSRLFEKNLDIVGIYNAVYRTAIAKQADAIFFIEEVTPLRRNKLQYNDE